jgi:hypothetical protein
MKVNETEKQEILKRINDLKISIKESEETEQALLSSEITNSEASIIKRFYKQLYDNRLNYIKELYEIINCSTKEYLNY